MTRSARIGLAAALLLGSAAFAMAQNGPATGGYPPEPGGTPISMATMATITITPDPTHHMFCATPSHSTVTWAVSHPTGITIALTGRGGAMTRNQLVE